MAKAFNLLQIIEPQAIPKAMIHLCVTIFVAVIMINRLIMAMITQLVPSSF